jgi:probable lipoprotein NlpC
MYSVRFLIICLLLPLFLLSPGCSLRSERTPKIIRLDGPALFDLNDNQQAYVALILQLRQWQGTPYKLGGLDRNGVDCSGLVFLTFRSQFGILLPRSTEDLSVVGQDVTREHPQPGDLLFFSTGFFGQHVGIYLSNNRFLHASKNRGVMLSNLKEEYWQSSFRKAKRIRVF